MCRIVIPCPTCATDTHHTLLHSVRRSDGDEYNNFWWEDEHQIVECDGCKTVSFRHLYTDSDSIAPDGGGGAYHEVTEALYPPRVAGRQSLREVFYLPVNIRRIYTETQLALVNDAPVLVGIGVRAIIETVCKDLQAQGDSLQARIDDLVNKQLLAQSGADVLHKLRVLGNDSAHEVKPHSSRQLALAMDVVEHLLQGAYVFPEKAKSELGG